MNYTMVRSGLDTASAFLDDCNVYEQKCRWFMRWEYTFKVLQMLTKLRFKVNLRKCKLLTANALILGLSLTAAGYTLGLKFMWYLS